MGTCKHYGVPSCTGAPNAFSEAKKLCAVVWRGQVGEGLDLVV